MNWIFKKDNILFIIQTVSILSTIYERWISLTVFVLVLLEALHPLVSYQDAHIYHRAREILHFLANQKIALSLELRLHLKVLRAAHHSQYDYLRRHFLLIKLPGQHNQAVGETFVLIDAFDNYLQVVQWDCCLLRQVKLEQVWWVPVHLSNAQGDI